jgi:hypothetical protein
MQTAVDRRIPALIDAIKAGTVGETSPERSTQSIRSARYEGGAKLLVSSLDDGEVAAFDAHRESIVKGLRTDAEHRYRAAVSASELGAARYRDAAIAWRERVTSLPDGANRVFIDEPFFIWSNTGLDFGAVGVPFGSLAHFKLHAYRNENHDLVFWFIWNNDTDNAVSMDLQTAVFADGFGTLGANGGIFTGGFSELSMVVNLKPLMWWHQPAQAALPQSTSSAQLFFAQADASDLFSVGAVKPVSIDKRTDVSYTIFTMPPRSSAVAQVAVEIGCTIDNGTIDLDFTNDFALVCPGMLITTH